MDPILPRRDRDAASLNAASLDACPGGAPGQLVVLLGLFDRITDHDALGRALASVAVHPEGAGFAQAWLLAWRPQRDVLELRRGAKAARRPAPLAESVEEALRARLEVEPSARDPQAGDHVITPARLHGVLARAWGAGAPERDDPPAGLPWSGAGVLDAVVLKRDGRPWGMLVGRWAAEPAEERRAALAGMAALAARAADAIASAHERRRRAQQAAALAQAARATVSALNLAEALQLVAKLAMQGTAARGSALWLAGAEGPPRLEVTQGPAGRRERIGRSLQHLAAQAVESGQARVLDDVTDEALLSPEAAAEVGALAVFPCAAFGRVLGALAVYDPAGVEPGEPAGFEPTDVEFVGALADLAASAADQARRFDELKHAEQQRRELAAQLRREERLAALGELAARMVHDARNPLASIAAFARRVHRALGETDPNREYLEIVIRESDRLEKLLAEQSDYVAPAAPALRLENLNAVVQEALNRSGEALVRRRVRLLKKLAPDLPQLLLDRDRIRRVVDNVLDSALDAVGVGGRIRVETRRANQYVVVDVAHDGPRAPGELLEQLFVPFASQRTGGPAVGLAVAQQIVRAHGGEVRVRSEGEWSTVLRFTLPVAGNEDRRQGGPDRRRVRDDRRATSPER